MTVPQTELTPPFGGPLNLECHNPLHQRFSARSGVLRPVRGETLSEFVRIAGEGRVLCKGPGFAHHGIAPALRSGIFFTADYHAANLEIPSADRSNF